MKTIRNIKELSKLVKTSKKYIISYIILSLLLSLVGIMVPFLSARQLVSITDGLWNKVIMYAVFIFAISIFRELINLAITYCSEKFSKVIMRQLQIDMAREILNIKVEHLDKHSNGLFIQRMTSDVNALTSIFTYGVDSITRILVDIKLTLFFNVIIISFHYNIKIVSAYSYYYIIIIVKPQYYYYIKFNALMYFDYFLYFFPLI